jgi:hypothetical protein
LDIKRYNYKVVEIFQKPLLMKDMFKEIKKQVITALIIRIKRIEIVMCFLINV